MKLFFIVFGISSGIMVGGGVIALLILVGIIPRIAQITNTKSFTFIGLFIINLFVLFLYTMLNVILEIALKVF